MANVTGCELWVTPFYVGEIGTFDWVDTISALCFFAWFFAILVLLYQNDRRAKHITDDELSGGSTESNQAHIRARFAPFLLTLHWRIFLLCGVQAFASGSYKLVTLNRTGEYVSIFGDLALIAKLIFSKTIERLIAILLLRDRVGSRVTCRAASFAICCAFLFAVYFVILLLLQVDRCVIDIIAQSVEVAFYWICFMIARSKKCSICQRTLYVCQSHQCPGARETKWKDGSAVWFCGALFAYYLAEAMGAMLCFLDIPELTALAFDLCVTSVDMILYALFFSPIVYWSFNIECNYWRNSITDEMGPLNQLIQSTSAVAIGRSEGEMKGQVPLHLMPVAIPRNQLRLEEVIYTSSGTKTTELSLYMWHTERVAVKRYYQRPGLEFGAQEYDDFLQEIRMQRELKHPNLIEWRGIFFDLPTTGIVMQYCPNGTLASFLEKKKMGTLREDGKKVKMMSLVLGVAKGLAYMHSRQVLHRDIKTRNVVLDDDWNCRIIDFDATVRFDAATRKYVAKKGEIAGTREYWAPEVATSSQFSTKSDVYSFSMVLWECLTFGNLHAAMPANPDQARREPKSRTSRKRNSKKGLKEPFLESDGCEIKSLFESNFPAEIGKALETGRRPPIPSHLPLNLTALLIECWAPKPEDRPEMDHVVDRLEEIAKTAYYDWSPHNEEVTTSVEIARKNSSRTASRPTFHSSSISFDPQSSSRSRENTQN